MTDFIGESVLHKIFTRVPRMQEVFKRLEATKVGLLVPFGLAHGEADRSPSAWSSCSQNMAQGLLMLESPGVGGVGSDKLFKSKLLPPPRTLQTQTLWE